MRPHATNRPQYRLYFDLREVEETNDAYISIEITGDDASFLGHPFPPGIVVSTERRMHGADVHLTRPQVRELRDTRTAILAEVGAE
jgi:hypothetical protein